MGDEINRKRYRCLGCGMPVVRYADMEEFQHAACGGLVVDVEENVRVRAEGPGDEVTALMVRLQRLPMLEALLADPLLDIALDYLASNHQDYDDGERRVLVQELRERLRKMRDELEAA